MLEKSICGIDAAAEQVQPQRHQAHVAGALTVAEQAALDPIGAGLIPQFRCGDGGSAVVVGVQAQDDGVAAGQVAAHPLDRVGIHVGRGHLDGGGQVDDQRSVRCRLDDVGHRVAHLFGVFQFRSGVGLRAVLEPPLRIGVFRCLVDAHPGAVGGDLAYLGPVGAEHHATLQDRRRVVEVHDGLRRPRARLERALDQFGPALRQHLNGDVVGDRALLDDLADEVEVRLARRREADLDLLVAHADKEVEHPPLARRAHGVDQCLVAVAQVHRTPHRRGGDDLVGPGPIERRRRTSPRHFSGERPIPVDRHRRRALRIPGGLAGVGRTGWGADRAGRRIGVDGMRIGIVHGSAPDSSGCPSDRRIKNTHDGKPVWIRTRRGVRGGASAARRLLYSEAPLDQNPCSAASPYDCAGMPQLPANAISASGRRSRATASRSTISGGAAA